MIEPLLIVLAIILFIVGIIGSVLPVLPGTPLSWLGLLILKFVPSLHDHVSWKVVILLGVFTVIVTVFDNILPIWCTRKVGGNNKVVLGAGIGFVTGFWFGPLGIILGPFVGALIGGIISGTRINQAFKHASGAFVGFLIGVVLKFINLGVLLFYFVKFLF